MLRVYIWNLTHGGRTRSRDEYRIQVQVNRFQRDTRHKTLVLGWWDDAGVFAGFDVRKHSGILGNPSSIQIRRATLRKAAASGISAHEKANGELAVAFRPDFFLEYVSKLEDIHGFGESVDDLRVLETVMDEGANEEFILNNETLNQVTQTRRSTVVRITRKIREASFKRRVLTAYGHQCAFCLIQLKLVDAAHIIPVAHERSTDETSNGIALCPLHHRAFDQSLVTINERYETMINRRSMTYLSSINLDGGMTRFIEEIRQTIHIPRALRERPNINYIGEANRIRGWN